MSVLTVASKSNPELILPVVAVATCVQEINPGSGLSVTFEDVDSIGSNGGKLELKVKDGSLVCDDEIVPYLRSNYEVLQSGDKDQVCYSQEFHFYFLSFPFLIWYFSRI